MPTPDEFAKSVLAVEAMDKNGTLETALAVLRQRKAASAESGEGDLARTVLDTTSGTTTLHFPKFKTLLGPELETIPLPAGVESLIEWGKRQCDVERVTTKLGKVGKTYEDIIRDPDVCEYVKWVHDHYPNDRWGEVLNDFASYLIRLNVRYRYL